MEEENLNNNLALIDEVFNNKTLSYRINGFAHACGMQNINVVKNAGVIFSTAKRNGLQKEDNQFEYFISVNKNNNKNSTISGNYGDLNFTFTNFHDKENLNRRILEIPFSILLIKPIDNDTYYFRIESIKKEDTRFEITKYREYKNGTVSSNVHFNANILDFSKILKLVKSFVYNPKLVFDTYNDIKEQKKVVFATNNVNKAIMQDEKLDKPMGKIKKFVKRITNND